MTALKGAETHAFAGKHPVGNVGVQIHHIDPVNKGEVVWTVNIQDLAIIGRLFNEGRVDMTKIIAVAGSEIEKPQYCRIIAGAKVDSILKGNVKPQKEGDHVRIISGNVLTGTKTAADGFIGFYANQLTVIPEGDKFELLGWAMPRFNKFSVSRAYFSWLCPKKEYNLDTNMNGGERPFVVTGLYERYLPMDIYPMYLLKACLAGDIDKMENLGIYEVVEEDFALADLYALDLDDILVGVQLDIVPQTDNGNHASQLHGNLAPNHNHAVKQVSPLVHIRQRNDAVAKLQLDGIHLQQAVHILRLTHFFRLRRLTLALDLSRLQVAGNHPSSHNEHKAHAQEENGVQIRYHTQERQGASHHIHNFGKAKKLLHNSGTELRLLGSLCDQDTR